MSLLKSLSAAAILTGAALAASPSYAVAFASYSAVDAANTLRWENIGGNGNGSTGTGGSLYTISSAIGTTAGSVDVNFSFLSSALAPSVTNVLATFTLLASVTSTPAQTSGQSLLQPGISGSFSFLSTAPITIGNRVYGVGSNLLSGTFNQAAISGENLGETGTFASATSAGATITYTSAFLDFSPTTAREFSVSLTSIAAALQALDTNEFPNRALRTFRAESTGVFSATPEPGINAVPEPATWALMIVGFGLVGIQTRRARKAAVAA